MPVTFKDMIAANKRNSVILVLLFCLFVAAVVLVLGLAIVSYIHPSAVSQLDLGRALLFGLLAGGISLLIALFGYFNGDKMILGVSGAKRVGHEHDPELFNVVEEMSIAAGVPMPSVYVINDSAPNAFATGRDPKHGIVCVTTGLRQKLTRDELQGVIAHEMAHIRNYDIRLMMLMAVLVGTVVMLSDLFWQLLRWGPSRSRRSDSDKGGAVVMAVLFVVAIILAIIAPILARIIQLAVSRQREYLADASAVQFTREPLGLARALAKIAEDTDVLEAANRGTAHLYIANPIKKFEARAASVFSSHPPIKERISRLVALAE